MPTLAEERCGGKPGRGSENRCGRGQPFVDEAGHPGYIKTCHRARSLLPLIADWDQDSLGDSCGSDSDGWLASRR